MDTKRSQSLRKVSATVTTKQKMPKSQSQASVTPSQAGETNADKNPLDALSRNTIRQTVERRSGLQDIDEDYLRRLTFVSKNVPKYEHAAGQRTPISTEPNPLKMQTGVVAQQQPVQVVTTAQEQVLSTQPVNAIPMQQEQQQQPQQQQYQTQYIQQQQQVPQQQVNYSPAAGEPEMCTTCPNCQTIIYLTRVSEEPPITNSMHGQPDGTAVGNGMS